jgi:hypothetical protein
MLLLFVTKYYKSAVHVGGDSVKSDQTLIPSLVMVFYTYNTQKFFTRFVLNFY